MKHGAAATLVRGRFVLTAGPDGVVEHGAVRMVGDRITAVGSYADLRREHPDDPVAGGPGDIVTPGFVNTHGHFSEALVSGIAEECTLWEWFAALVHPIAPHLTEADAHIGALVAGAQLVRSGVTTASDMFVCDPRPDGTPITPGVVRGLEELGLRGVVSFGAGDLRSGASAQALLQEHEALRQAADSSALSRFRVGVAAVGAQSPALLEQSIAYARERGDGIHIHLQEVREEVTAVRNEHGVTPIGLCAREGMFAVPTLAAHCVWVDQHDVDLLADHGVSVAHNPVANMILASGVCPVPTLRRAGVEVGLGVDGPGSNDSQDFLQVVKTAVLLQRVHQLQATAMLAEQAFRLATLGGARALGLDDEIGSLEVGKAADLVVLDGDAPALAAVHDPYQAVVYCAGPTEVRHVWVAGRHVLTDGHLTTVDPAEVAARARPAAHRLIEAAGLSSRSRIGI